MLRNVRLPYIYDRVREWNNGRLIEEKRAKERAIEKSKGEIVGDGEGDRSIGYRQKSRRPVKIFACSCFSNKTFPGIDHFSLTNPDSVQLTASLTDWLTNLLTYSLTHSANHSLNY